MAYCSLQNSSLFRYIILILNLNLIVIVYISVTLTYKDNGNQSFKHRRTYVIDEGISSQSLTSSTTTNSQLVTSTSHFFLTILVLSTAKGLDRRDGIRQSWMKGYKEKTPRILLKFSIGTANLSISEIRELKIEQENYGDLLFLTDLHDFYSNLAKKVLKSFIVLDAHHNFSYLLKCDDDTFVSLDKLLNELKQRNSNKSLYWGHHIKRGTVFKTGKWAEANWFLCSTYLPFAVGAGYILSHNLVKRVTSNAEELILYNNEDTSMGAWLSPYKMERRHDKRFNNFGENVNCQEDLVIHYQYRKQMLRRQKSLNERGSVCTEEEERAIEKEYGYIFMIIYIAILVFLFCVLCLFIIMFGKL